MNILLLPGRVRTRFGVTLIFSNCIGTFPETFSSIKGKVCIIPNKKMITHSGNSSSEYFLFLENIVDACESKGKEVFLLNHESKGDLELCNLINDRLNNRLEVVSGLNALEIKGVIGASYAVISSRFHGVASALNQGVPCLATGWNHKYQMLMKDFGQDDMMINITKNEDALTKLDRLLDDSQNQAIKQELYLRKSKLLDLISTMWERIWDIIK